MNITIFHPKTKTIKHYKAAVSEYTKRLTRYCKLKLVAYATEDALLKKLEGYAHYFLILSQGDTVSSEDLASQIESLGVTGQSKVAFILIPATEEALAGKLQDYLRRPLAIDMDKTTAPGHFPSHATKHLNKDESPWNYSVFALTCSTTPIPLSLTILTEQIYRSYRIIHGQAYHK